MTDVLKRKKKKRERKLETQRQRDFLENSPKP